MDANIAISIAHFNDYVAQLPGVEDIVIAYFIELAYALKTNTNHTNIVDNDTYKGINVELPEEKKQKERFLEYITLNWEATIKRWEGKEHKSLLKNAKRLIQESLDPHNDYVFKEFNKKLTNTDEAKACIKRGFLYLADQFTIRQYPKDFNVDDKILFTFTDEATFDSFLKDFIAYWRTTIVELYSGDDESKIAIANVLSRLERRKPQTSNSKKSVDTLNVDTVELTTYNKELIENKLRILLFQLKIRDVQKLSRALVTQEVGVQTGEKDLREELITMLTSLTSVSKTSIDVQQLHNENNEVLKERIVDLIRILESRVKEEIDKLNKLIETPPRELVNVLLELQKKLVETENINKEDLKNKTDADLRIRVTNIIDKLSDKVKFTTQLNESLKTKEQLIKVLQEAYRELQKENSRKKEELQKLTDETLRKLLADIVNKLKTTIDQEQITNLSEKASKDKLVDVLYRMQGKLLQAELDISKQRVQELTNAGLKQQIMEIVTRLNNNVEIERLTELSKTKTEELQKTLEDAQAKFKAENNATKEELVKLKDENLRARLSAIAQKLINLKDKEKYTTLSEDALKSREELIAGLKAAEVELKKDVDEGLKRVQKLTDENLKQHTIEIVRKLQSNVERERLTELSNTSLKTALEEARAALTAELEKNKEELHKLNEGNLRLQLVNILQKLRSVLDHQQMTAVITETHKDLIKEKLVNMMLRLQLKSKPDMGVSREQLEQLQSDVIRRGLIEMIQNMQFRMILDDKNSEINDKNEEINDLKDKLNRQQLQQILMQLKNNTNADDIGKMLKKEELAHANVLKELNYLKDEIARERNNQDEARRKVIESVNQFKQTLETEILTPEQKQEVLDVINYEERDKADIIQQKLDEGKLKLANIKEDSKGAVRVFIRVKGKLDEGNRSCIQKENSSELQINCGDETFESEKRVNKTSDSKAQTSKNSESTKRLHSSSTTKPKSYELNDAIVPRVFRKHTSRKGGTTPPLTSSDTTYKSPGDVYGIFPSTSTNTDIYEKELKTVFNQVIGGYNVVLFGYGYSGSGKTYSLLRTSKQDDKSIVELLLNDTTFTDKCKTIKLKSVFELYYDKDYYMSHKEYNLNELTGTKIELYSEKDSSKFKSTDFKVPGNLKLTVDAIDTLRKKTGRVKSTINNKESSRSHLFITIEVVTQSNTTGYITIVDMAGREDPIDIMKIYFKPDRRLTGTSEKAKLTQYVFDNKEHIHINRSMFSIIKNSFNQDFRNIKTASYKKNDTCIENINDYFGSQVNKKGLEDKNLLKSLYYLGKFGDDTIYPGYHCNSKDDFEIRLNSIILNGLNIVEILAEGVYVNESINHLMYFLSNRMGNSKEIKQDLGKINDPQIITANYDVHNFLVNPAKSKSIGMIEALEELNTLGKVRNENKPTKFIMLCCVRQEESYCEDSLKTLEFAKSISSTNTGNTSQEGGGALVGIGLNDIDFKVHDGLFVKFVWCVVVFLTVVLSVFMMEAFQKRHSTMSNWVYGAVAVMFWLCIMMVVALASQSYRLFGLALTVFLATLVGAFYTPVSCTMR